MGEAQLPGLGWDSLALSFGSLGAVCLLAYVALKLLAGRGLGRSTGVVKVVARCPLDARRAVYLIETAGRCFLVGAGEGPMALLAEVDAAKGDLLAGSAVAPRGRFAEILARVSSRPPSGPVT